MICGIPTSFTSVTHNYKNKCSLKQNYVIHVENLTCILLLITSKDLCLQMVSEMPEHDKESVVNKFLN